MSFRRDIGDIRIDKRFNVIPERFLLSCRFESPPGHSPGKGGPQMQFFTKTFEKPGIGGIIIFLLSDLAYGVGISS